MKKSLFGLMIVFGLLFYVCGIGIEGGMGMLVSLFGGTLLTLGLLPFLEKKLNNRKKKDSGKKTTVGTIKSEDLS